jgi:hypothetical protein
MYKFYKGYAYCVYVNSYKVLYHSNYIILRIESLMQEVYEFETEVWKCYCYHFI